MYHHDTHQTAWNDLLKALKTHWENSVKLYSLGGKTRCGIHFVHIQANIKLKLNLFVSCLQHQGLTSNSGKCFDTNMRYIFTQVYGCPFITLGETPAGCYTYLPFLAVFIHLLSPNHPSSLDLPMLLIFFSLIQFIKPKVSLHIFLSELFYFIVFMKIYFIYPPLMKGWA